APTVDLLDRHLFAVRGVARLGAAAVGATAGVELSAVAERVAAGGGRVCLIADVGNVEVLVVLVRREEGGDLTVLAIAGIGDEVDVAGAAGNEDGLNRIETGVTDRVRRQSAVLVRVERAVDGFQIARGGGRPPRTLLLRPFADGVADRRVG